MNGRKDDQGKLEWDKFLWPEATEIMKVLQFGAKKYEWGNWQKVPNAKERYQAALIRHILAYLGGERNDPESGLSHLAHAGCNILFLSKFERQQHEKVIVTIPGPSLNNFSVHIDNTEAIKQAIENFTKCPKNFQPDHIEGFTIDQIRNYKKAIRQGNGKVKAKMTIKKGSETASPGPLNKQTKRRKD